MALVVEGPKPDSATVGDAMSNHVPTVDPDRGLGEAADAMSARDVHRLVVTRDPSAAPDGIITAYDVFAIGAADVEVSPDAAEPSQPVAAGPGSARSTDADEPATAEFDDQGICEACGTLTADLSPFNGQLLCADCRDM
jgi:hypothetical protein